MHYSTPKLNYPDHMHVVFFFFLIRQTYIKTSIKGTRNPYTKNNHRITKSQPPTQRCELTVPNVSD